MFAVNTFVALFALAAPFLVRADVTPSGPAPGDSFNEGSTCLINWDGDTNSTTIWKNMAIELMTGDNFKMVHLTTVATNQDGTVTGRFSYPCPQVTPNSAIYFYQFSNPQTPTKTWTGRFTIAAADGSSTPPANAIQPENGAAIPWGTGALVDPSKAVAAPSFASSGTSVTASLPMASANSSTVALTASGSSTTSSSGPATLTTGLSTILISATASSTSSPSSTAQTTGKASGALGAMAGFDTRVLAAAAVATLALSFVW